MAPLPGCRYANSHVDTLADQADRMVIDIQLRAQQWIAGEKVR